MSRLYDLVLERTLAEGPARFMLFGAFLVHMVFVLLTLGTAIVGVTWYLRRRFGPVPAGDTRDQDVLRPFFVFKSLAIVFGVGPLMIFQLFEPIPLFTAVNLTAPLWALVPALLVGALLLLELLAERRRDRPGAHLVMAVVGLALLLAVPGIFVLVLTTTEHPEAWPSVLARGALPAALSVHFVLRLAHVVGAAVLFGAAMAWLRTAPEREGRRRSLVGWMLGAILFQVIVGIALYATVRPAPQALVAVLVLAGVLAAGLLVWRVFRAQRDARALGTRPVMVLLLFVLTPMLLARQGLQDRILRPMNAALDREADGKRERLRAYHAAAVGSWQAVSEVPYEASVTLYSRSCSFCHGAVANGEGPNAPDLAIPPENVAAMRATRDTVRRILTRGIHGTAMPYFGIYTRDELDRILDYLEAQGLRASPDRIALMLSPDARLEAERTWKRTCAVCHGEDGRGRALSARFAPPPPDLTKVSFAPWYLHEVITEGYPGTMMRSFAGLPDEVRWALVERVAGLYGER